MRLTQLRHVAIFYYMLYIYGLPLHIRRWREPSEANTFVIISSLSDDIYPLHHLLLRFYEWMCPSALPSDSVLTKYL